MKTYLITAENIIKLVETPPVAPNVGQAKVRITRAGITDFDIAYFGKPKKVPFCPCRQAVGVISATNELTDSDLKKGDRVFVSTYLPCGDCFYCKTDRDDLCHDMMTLGKDTDGLLRDFVNLPCENLFKIPDQVPDRDAVFAEYVAIATKTLDLIKFEKGEYIAVVGGNAIANILSQLIIYYQAVPIFIDSDSSNIECAHRSGIYYTIDSSQGNTQKALSELTGGRMAKYVIYVTDSKNSFANVMSYVTSGGTLVICGIAENKMSADLNSAFVKHLEIKTVANGSNEIRSALNFLSQKIINLGFLVKKYVTFSEVPLTFSKGDDNKNGFYETLVDCLND